MNRWKCFLCLVVCALLLPTLVWSMDPETMSGTVLAKEMSSRYTILQVQQEDKKVWLAASGLEVAVGDKVEYMGGVRMEDFYVKGLDRTFKEIYFMTNIRQVVTEQVADKNKKAAPTEKAAMPDDENHQNVAAGQKAVAVPLAGEVVKAEAELSVAEVFAQRKALVGKVIGVRGKVLKVSKNILGRTWVTLADGTGTAPNDVLRVTTKQEDIAVGETFSATGTVSIDVDLGAPGYQYQAILEEATLEP